MDIKLRLIQQDSLKDRENYLALQKSVALFPDIRLNNEEMYEDISWQEQFKNENRICYVIETAVKLSYCGECAVKDISAKIPEIEIELMQEYRHQGIGYRSIIMMLEKLAEKYGKQEFCAKVEPDNYASQFLMEKLKGIPVGLTKDYIISDERSAQFIETHRYLLDERMCDIAERFGVEADLLLTNLLVYKLNLNDIQMNYLNEIETMNKRKHIDSRRKLSKEKFKDTMLEMMEGLEKIKSLNEAKGIINEKIADMEARLINKMKLMEAIDIESR